MESRPQNPEFRINSENFHPCIGYKVDTYFPLITPSAFSMGTILKMNISLKALAAGSLLNRKSIEPTTQENKFFYHMTSSLGVEKCHAIKLINH